MAKPLTMWDYYQCPNGKRKMTIWLKSQHGKPWKYVPLVKPRHHPIVIWTMIRTQGSDKFDTECQHRL